MRYLLAALLIVGWAVNANAEIVTEVADYKHEDAALEGYAARRIDSIQTGYSNRPLSRGAAHNGKQ